MPPTSPSRHEDPFPQRRFSARFTIRQETFAETHGNGQDAPEAVIQFISIGGFPGARARRSTGIL